MKARAFYQPPKEQVFGRLKGFLMSSLSVKSKNSPRQWGKGSGGLRKKVNKETRKQLGIVTSDLVSTIKEQLRT